MTTTLKRKQSPASDSDTAEPSKRRFAETDATPPPPTTSQPQSISPQPQPQPQPDTDNTPPQQPDTNTADPQKDRLARFAALRARNTDSRKANQKATVTETARLTTDPSLLATLNRKRDAAQEKLLKADAEDAGEDYERKRAWDWTVDESEKWDAKLSKKARNKADNHFQDYSQDARKVYERQLREMKPDREAYEREKRGLIERAAARGGLEVVQTEDGELIAVDRDGSFYSTAETTDFVDNRPSKDAVDKLVAEIRKAEEVSMRKRKERLGKDDDGDVTYINDKNKQVCFGSLHLRVSLHVLTHPNSSTKSWLASTTSTLPTSARALSEAQRYSISTSLRHKRCSWPAPFLSKPNYTTETNVLR